jgi:uncharacterized protein YjbI with pentapeptide repeats
MLFGRENPSNLAPILIKLPMVKNIFDDQIFDKFDISQGLHHEFTNCTFRGCDFSNESFGQAELTDCTFVSCNLSMVTFGNTVLNNVKFNDCKVMGVDFSKCSKFLFSVSFEKCVLNYSVFLKNDLKNTIFKRCILQETSFIETNLNSAKFLDCDLTRATFDRANLEKADLSTSRNYIINPEINKLKKTKFSMPDVLGLLSNLDIIITDIS